MAIFMSTGGGDIYAAETKEQCIEAILEDAPGLRGAVHEFEEVAGETKIRIEDDDLATLEQAYTELGYGYCIATTNLD